MPVRRLPPAACRGNAGTVTIAPPAVRPSSVRPSSVLPPAGPAWFGSVMGTAILATLLPQIAPGVRGVPVLAHLVLVVAWAALSFLVASSVRRWRTPGALAATIADLPSAAQWGMVSMALLAVGAATSTVIGSWPALAATAWAVDGVLWVVGTALGFVTAIGFAARLVRNHPGEPTTVWGLAVVPPMVSATTGAALAPHAGPLAGVVLTTAAAGFVVSLCLGTIVFGVAYHHHWRDAPVPVAASASAWIPLGIVGQSVAAAHTLVAAAGEDLSAHGRDVADALAHGYGVVMLVAGVPLVAWAMVVTVRGFRARMPFTPGWWALTFPVGTLALGAHLLGAAAGWRWPGVVAAAALVVLVGTWTLCTAATVTAIVSGARTPARD